MRRPSTRPVVPLWAALLLGAASGPVLDAAFPDRGIWPLAFLGISLVLISLIGRTAASALLVAFVASCTFYFTQISWASLFLGPLPMSALAILESLFAAAGGLAIMLAYRWIPRVWPSILGRTALLPVAIAGLWTAREAWAAVWPYGGFSWGRAAMSQADSPLTPLFAWVGMSGVTFLMVLIVALSIECIRLGGISPLLRATAPIALITGLVIVPAWPIADAGSLRVAAVQGNGKAGYFDRSTADELLQAQLLATEPLFGTKADVVLWPEGTTYNDPLEDRYTQQVFDTVSRELDAPLVAQGVTERSGRFYNSAVLWQEGKGVQDIYDKRHPVPFGEYIPDRAFWRPFAPDLIDLIDREYTPGRTDMTFRIERESKGAVIAGINICFDIVDDQILRESVEQGAEVIFASSNTADFGRTDESAQQLAIARIRAVELGRSVVNISTVGLSAVIDHNGHLVDELPWYTAAAMVDDVDLSQTVTPAVAGGRQVEWLVSAVGLAGLIIGGISVRRKVA